MKKFYWLVWLACMGMSVKSVWAEKENVQPDTLKTYNIDERNE